MSAIPIFTLAARHCPQAMVGVVDLIRGGASLLVLAARDLRFSLPVFRPHLICQQQLAMVAGAGLILAGALLRVADIHRAAMLDCQREQRRWVRLRKLDFRPEQRRFRLALHRLHCSRFLSRPVRAIFQCRRHRRRCLDHRCSREGGVACH
jgi:hypothetical protein